MLIESVHIKNFRSIKDLGITIDDLTVLVGRNGSGKSAILGALNVFYEKATGSNVEDFFNRDTSQEISISVTFSSLSSEASQLFSKYIQSGKLTLERVITYDGTKFTNCLYGILKRNPDFEVLRSTMNVKGGASAAKTIYGQLIGLPKYSVLQPWSSLENTKQTLDEWEAQNQAVCALTRDEGQFFGFKQVAQGYLSRFTRLLYIPPVKDAVEDTDGSKSLLSQIIGLSLTNKLAENPELVKFKQKTQNKYSRLLVPAGKRELKNISSEMTKTLNELVPGAKIDLDWIQPPIDFSDPLTQAKLTEDGYSTEIQRTGNGLQRALILTLLQHLEVRKRPLRGEPVDSSDNPYLVLVIEEPELYQHPNRQRHFQKVLRKLAEGRISGVAKKTQIIYSTHSPLLLGIDLLPKIKLLRKQNLIAGIPGNTRVYCTNFNEITGKLNSAYGNTNLSSNAIEAKLKTLMTPFMNEGFFADVVVLVEGDFDRAAILAYAEALKIDLESIGISVIPCTGKSNLDRPKIIFQTLGIPTYCVWDSDFKIDRARWGDNPSINRNLLKLMNSTEEDWPNSVEPTYACFKTTLDELISKEFGLSTWNTLYADVSHELGLPKSVKPNPQVIREIILRGYSAGKRSNTLKKIIKRIMSLK